MTRRQCDGTVRNLAIVQTFCTLFVRNIWQDREAYRAAIGNFGNEENSTRKIDTGIKLAIARCTRLLIGEQRNSTKKMDTSMQKSLRREATSQERGMRCCASQDRDYIIAARARRTTRRVAASKQEKILENGGGEREARLRLINAGASSSRVSSLASSSLEKPSGRVYC